MTKKELLQLLEPYPDNVLVLARFNRNELANCQDLRRVEEVKVFRLGGDYYVEDFFGGSETFKASLYEGAGPTVDAVNLV